MNQRYRNESTGGFHGDELRDRDRAMRDRDDRFAREAASARDWDQRDLGTRGGEYADYGSYGDRGFGQGAGGRSFREAEYGGEDYSWGGQRDNSGDQRPRGAVNQRDFGGGQGHGSAANYGGGYGGGEGYRQRQMGGQRAGRQSFGPGGYRPRDPGFPRDQGFAGQNYWGQGGTDGTDFGSGQGFAGQGYGDQQYGGYGNQYSQSGGQFRTQRGMRNAGGPAGQYGGQGYGMGRGMAGAGMGAGMAGAGMYDGDRTQAGRSFRGAGPKGWRRSDERLQDDICERLTDDPWIDASDVSVQVSSGVVTLEGSVDDRRLKHRIEDMVEQCGGVTEIRNFLSVPSRGMGASSTSSTSASRTSTSGRGTTTGSTAGTTTGSTGTNAGTGSTGATPGKH